MRNKKSKMSRSNRKMLLAILKDSKQNKLSYFTSIPKTLKGKKKKAEGYMKLLEQLVSFRCDDRNVHLSWLEDHKEIDLKFFFKFVNYWYWLSRYQPQTLWRIMSVFPDKEEQAEVLPNAIEESGLRKKGHQPHWWHLIKLIEKLGGKIKPDTESEQMLKEFLHLLDTATPAQAIGYISSIEFPGTTISSYFTTLITRVGKPEMIKSDFYIKVHTLVEYEHIIKSAGSMLLWMHDKERQKKYNYKPEEIVEAFQRGMEFWEGFWDKGFKKLGYTPS